MRDAFGGAFAIKIFLVFIIIYMFFTAIALNYARAFKVKNKVIDYLEDNEIITIDGMSAAQFEKMSRYFENEILDRYNYDVDIDCGGKTSYCYRGVGIKQIDIKSGKSDNLGVYYRVETYFTWQMPFIKMITALGNGGNGGEAPSGVVAISGETRPIIKK